MRQSMTLLYAVVTMFFVSSPVVAKDRIVDAWSGIVLNCGVVTGAPWAESACRRMIGEMQKRAEAAKVRLVAVPVFADDAALDRRAADEGLDVLKVLHVRFEVSQPTGSANDILLRVRSLQAGKLMAMRKDGPYTVLGLGPAAIVYGSAAALNTVPVLADQFFTATLKPQT
ncbi:MAG: hypothetical protein ACRCWF_00370 [Beijerinckiaceae bacterium]